MNKASSNPKRWCCAALNMPANLESLAVTTGWKRWVFIPIPKKGNAKECSNYSTIVLTRLVTLKILQARLQQYVNHELPDIQAGFRKGRRTREQIANICWIERDLLDLLLSKKQESSRKTKTKTKHFYFCFVDYTKAFISALLTMPKPLTVWITTTCEKFFKRWEYQTTLPALEKYVCRSRRNS